MASVDVQGAEEALDQFDQKERMEALAALHAETGPPPDVSPLVNLHAHTFFSYNAYGFSPSHYAWLARREGLKVAGIVDFDVLDGVEEFHEAGRQLGLKTCASIESRVFVPEFADKVINSPGEPGIAYHMGAGFVHARLDGEAAEFIREMRRGAERRTRDLIDKVNDHLAPVTLAYDHDVAPLTPHGNATERHVCLAYAEKAAAHFSDPLALIAYWTGKLGEPPAELDLPAGPILQAWIRARTMKQGGVGYVQPDEKSFPLMADMDRFTLLAGAIPTLTWLDGTSDGEQEMARYIEVGKRSGAAAINIIPDRNFTEGIKDQKLQNLYDVVALAEANDFPVIVGTEMNGPGQCFVDDFESEELRPLVPVFMKGAYILYAHTVLQRQASMGYLSEWASTQFPGAADKNAFYAEFGEQFQPGGEDRLAPMNNEMSGDKIMDLLA